MADKKKRFVQLSEDLERLAMCAVIKGVVPDSELKEEELSKTGRLVLRAIKNLRESGEVADELPEKSLRVAAAEILGGDRREIGLYISACVHAGAGKEIADLLKVTRDKSTIVEVLNVAGNQLASGKLDVGEIEAILEVQSDEGSTVASASDQLADGIPPEPSGIKLKTLPLLSQASGGLMGMWAVAAEAGVGKSTLALQLAVDYGRCRPVLYYDAENGPGVMLYRIGKRFNMDVNAAREATKNIYFRESIRTLNADLRRFKGKNCLVVIDSLQKLPTSVEHRRVGLGAWVHRLEALKKKGHCVLLISEKNREQYGKANQQGFKETGDVEYSADFGFQLLSDKTDDALLKVFIVKNRNRPHLGQTCYLERVNGFTFVERT